MTLNPVKAYRQYVKRKREKAFKSLKITWLGYIRSMELQMIIQQPLFTKDDVMSRFKVIADHVCETVKILADELRS